jgi:hypothetical protein
VAPLSSHINDLCDYSVQVSCMILDMAPSVICLSMSFFLVLIQDQHQNGDSLFINAVDYYYLQLLYIFIIFVLRSNLIAKVDELRLFLLFIVLYSFLYSLFCLKILHSLLQFSLSVL